MRALIVPLVFLLSRLWAGPVTTDNHIKVDQFGYRCSDQKIAVISNPQTGFNSTSPFSPGTGANQYQVRDWSTDAVVYSGTIVAWNSGTTHAQSGDKVWWFDFSSFTTSGAYYIFDAANNVGSYKFEIRDDVYKDALKHAVRSFYYQRCGCAKTAAHAGSGWADGVCHTGTQQDTDCRLYSNPISGTSKNLSGGWHDAGDYNKYVNFTWAPLTDLLLAYEETPTVWTDDYNLPESGNGIPDLLDEIKYELDWLLKMQNSNGSVLSVVGGGGDGPPSADSDPRRYGPATTSASLTAASVFAQAAIVYNSLGIPAMTTYASTLQTASQNAWTWANANTNVTFNNTGIIAAGEQEVNDYGRLVRKIAAAGFLYKLTGNSTYKTFFESNYTSVHLIDWTFAYPFESVEQDILLYYAKASGATGSVVSNIQTKYTSSMSTGSDNLGAFNNSTDAYRAYLANNNYTWGSNNTKAHQANMFMAMNEYNLNAANATKYENAASGFLHYMHGVNPLALVYMTNMDSYGAENSVNEIYHSWFHDGDSEWDRVGTSTYGPAPGFIPGGPNPSWSLDGCCPSGCGSPENNAYCTTLTPPAGQPVQKSYRDWNTSWPQNSWSVTENGIYYNASYIRLASKFVSNGTCGVATPVHDKKEEAHAHVHVYPNPFTHQTFVEVETTAPQPLLVRIFSMHGKEMNTALEAVTNKQVEIGAELESGMYMVELSFGGEKKTVKVIKR